MPAAASRTRKRPHAIYRALLRSRLLALIFAVLIVVAIIFSDVERYNWISPRVCRLLGYPALVTLLIPYLYIIRRWRLRKYLGNMTGWMVWHIHASFLGLCLTLIHSQGRAGEPLTFWTMLLFWSVVASGVVGFLGQRMFFRLMPFLVQRELGLERLEPERQRLYSWTEQLISNSSLISIDDIFDWENFCEQLHRPDDDSAGAASDWRSTIQQSLWDVLPESTRDLIRVSADARNVPVSTKNNIVFNLNKLLVAKATFYSVRELKSADLSPKAKEFLEKTKKRSPRLGRLVLECLFPDQLADSPAEHAEIVVTFGQHVKRHLRRPFPSWWWIFTPWVFQLVPQNTYRRALQLVEKQQQGVIHELWRMVEKRRKMNMEFCIHGITNVWLLVHGPAAWGLLVLVSVHVFTSIWYGGF